MEELTKTQEKVFQIIVDYLNEHGYAPSVREVADISESTVSSVWVVMEALCNKNYLSFDGNRRSARAMRVKGFKVVEESINLPETTTMTDYVTDCCKYDAGIDGSEFNYCPVCGKKIITKK